MPFDLNAFLTNLPNQDARDAVNAVHNKAVNLPVDGITDYANGEPVNRDTFNARQVQAEAVLAYLKDIKADKAYVDSIAFPANTVDNDSKLKLIVESLEESASQYKSLYIDEIMDLASFNPLSVDNIELDVLGYIKQTNALVQGVIETGTILIGSDYTADFIKIRAINSSGNVSTVQFRVSRDNGTSYLAVSNNTLTDISGLPSTGQLIVELTLTGGEKVSCFTVQWN